MRTLVSKLIKEGFELVTDRFISESFAEQSGTAMDTFYASRDTYNGFARVFAVDGKYAYEITDSLG